MPRRRWQGDFVADGRLGDDELWRCVDATLTEIVLPAIAADDDHDDAWARAATVQLIGLVRYAARRPTDATSTRIAELADALTRLGANPLVDWDGDRGDRSVNGAVGRALAAAVTRTDADADAVRSVLRPIVVAHLDDELAVTAPLVDAFRGRLSDDA
jgi:hypothetical protein